MLSPGCQIISWLEKGNLQRLVLDTKMPKLLLFLLFSEVLMPPEAVRGQKDCFIWHAAMICLELEKHSCVFLLAHLPASFPWYLKQKVPTALCIKGWKGDSSASSAEMAQGCFSAMAPFPEDRVLVAATPIFTKLRNISAHSNHEPGRRARRDLYFWAQRDSGWRSYLEICFHLYWTPKESPGTKDSCKTILSYSVVRTESEE